MSLYRIKIFKYADGDPTRKWSNTYEVGLTDEFPEHKVINDALIAQYNTQLPSHAIALQGVVDRLVVAEKDIHTEYVRFDYATVSTYGAGDTEVYEAIEFANYPLSGVGDREVLSDKNLEDREVTYFVRFQTRLGRPGKRLFQGCLVESDVEGSSSIRKRLASDSPLSSTGTSWIGYKTGIETLVTDPADEFDFTLVLAGRNKDGNTVVRRVLGVEVGGVSVTNLVRR